MVLITGINYTVKTEARASECCVHLSPYLTPQYNASVQYTTQFPHCRQVIVHSISRVNIKIHLQIIYFY